jgi:hypothetical protein
LPAEEPVPFYKNEYFWMVIAIICFLALNVYFLVTRSLMHSSSISIWFFIGVLLTIYGGLIFGYGVYEW